MWAKQIRPTLNTYPIMPDGITDRNADIWESLLSIADAAGGSWPERARVSAVTLVTLTMSATPELRGQAVGRSQDCFRRDRRHFYP